MTKAKRILLVASAGGHWVQMSRLTEAFAGHDTAYVTTMAGAVAPSGSRPVWVVTDASQSEPMRLPLLGVQLVKIMLTFKPDLVMSTGAAPGLVALHIGKLLGARTVWIDSLANSEKLSWSGVMARRCADIWLTQWPHLVQNYEGLECHGAVL
jgi:hypothetical protein